jgi:hypothetical protein
MTHPDSVAAAPVERVLLGACGLPPLAGALDRAGRWSLVEPDPDLLKAVLAREDLAPAVRSGRLRILPFASAEKIAELWDPPAGERALGRVVFFDGAGDDPSRRRFFAEVQERIAARERDAALDTGAMVALGEQAVENALRNVQLLSATAPLAGFLKSLPGLPAVIISAGPSLDANAAELRGLGDRALLIAVDTAVKPLSRHGVAPHLVLAVDPRERNVLNLAGTDLSRSVLLCELATHPDLVRLPARGTVLFAAEGALGQALAALGIELPWLSAFGSVATAALDLACRAGCQPVLFVGQDLAYTGGQAYAAGTAPGGSPLGPESEERWARDLDGRSVRTSERLLAFRDWMERRMAREPSRLFINASEGGILGGPAVRLPLRDALARHAAEPRAIPAAIERALSARPAHTSAELRRAIETLAGDGLRGLEELERGVPLQALTGRRALTALVDILEARALLELRARWPELASPARERSLYSVLGRGYGTVLELAGGALGRRG